jgi:hypothetical protein
MVAKIKSISGSSYQKLPCTIRTVLNIENKDDVMCFLWCILAYFFPLENERNPERVINYKALHALITYEYDACSTCTHRELGIPKTVDNVLKNKLLPSFTKEYVDQVANLLNLKDIEYPMKVKDLTKFENRNRKIAINVFTIEGEGKLRENYTVIPLRISNHSDREHIISLLLYKDHYCLIKNFNGFMRGKSNTNNSQFYCTRCLNYFSSEAALQKHMEYCKNHNACKIIMPTEDNKKLKFNSHYMKSRLPFVIYADFETINVPIQSATPNSEKSYQTQKWEQQVLSYSWYLKSDYPNLVNGGQKFYRSSTSSEDTLKEFVNDMINLNSDFFYKLRPDHHWNKRTQSFDIISNMLPLTEEEENQFQNTTHCNFCNHEFDKPKMENITFKRSALHIKKMLLFVKYVVIMLMNWH